MPKVLVVDDSPVDRALVEGILKRDHSLKLATASNGIAALEKAAEWQPDLVVTDLQMPEMDGLQLVTAMCLHFPDVPVVLITAHGSEELALQALEQGAATYVPKTQLGERLADAVDHVLAHCRTDQSYERLTQCMDSADLRFALAYDPALFSRLSELVLQMAVSVGVCDTRSQVRLGMALEEALSYMALHGNYELSDDEVQAVQSQSESGLALLEQRQVSPPFADRRLRVRCQIAPTAATITIEHEGPSHSLPRSHGDDTLPELEAASDRSLVLMEAFLDEVRFNDAGTGLQLVKRREAAATAL